MTSNNTYIMRDQMKDRVASIMASQRRAGAMATLWSSPASLLSFMAVVLYLTALSATA